MLEGLKNAYHAEADDHFMALALTEARRSAATGEVPIGAVLVRDGGVISRAHNASVGLHDPSAHAEIVALRLAGQRERNYRFPGTTLYVTAEPCPMCVGALIHARVGRVVFGCAAPKAGALGSVCNLAERSPGSPHFEHSGGVRAAESRALLQRFFRARRGA